MSDDMSNRDARIAALMAPMLKRTFYVAFSYPAGDFKSLLPVLEDHLSWLVDLEEDGRLFLSGPFLPEREGDAMSGEGMTVFRADSLEEATALASQDPFVVAGLRTITVRPWQVNEGSVSIRANLATGTYDFG